MTTRTREDELREVENAKDDAITSIYELLDAIEAVIKAADLTKREALTRTIDAYAHRRESIPCR